MRRTAAGLALAATALLPATVVAPASTGTTGPSTAAAAGATVPSSTVAAAGATVPSAARAVAGGTARPGAHGVPVDLPRPPPVDVDLLPGDGPPTAAPGVRQESACVGATHTPDRARWPNLLWGQRLFSLPELWSTSRGRAVRIAVIDTGVARHPLLAGRLIAGGDYVAGGDGLSDCDGHGTAVAGIAAASADPGSGFAGVAPAAEVISIRQSSPSFSVPGQGDTRQAAGNLNTLAAAIVHAVDLGAGVINISEVSCAPPNAPGSAELQVAIHSAVLRNVVVVAAAGNAGPRAGPGHDGACPDQPRSDTVAYPGWFDDDVLTVAAVAPNGLASQFSYPGPWVDVAAPGERLMSLSPGGPGVTDQLSLIDTTAPIQGTSFAAPAVAGLAALIRARFPRLTARQVMDRITATAAQHASGRSDTVGFGVVDPVAALTRSPAVLPPPAGSPAAGDTGTLQLAAASTGPAPTGQGALWGGLLALLGALTAAALAVGRLRTGWRPGTRR
ncbi:MAG TPA: type VII secretion-associated serine protease mycosin [Pseudonocardia sp.]|nr:type VII secretion-associated serine protease mycosin [Pseudonocardia sp.]